MSPQRISSSQKPTEDLCCVTSSYRLMIISRTFRRKSVVEEMKLADSWLCPYLVYSTVLSTIYEITQMAVHIRSLFCVRWWRCVTETKKPLSSTLQR